MSTMTKRVTVYFDPDVHKLLRLKAAATESSISELVNQAIRADFTEDQGDLTIFEERSKEPTISYEVLLKKLKADGKI